ncbi:TraB/GumN family protein [Halalkalibacillus halophilus]|uniref:TraB/GumN family protein n=1 Tax=Halalkalibacillus halophilus TaxID=392827 RepID=UPI00040DF188|nr:TraB/GumN family protein [Halalkalibacillus halophilus]
MKKIFLIPLLSLIVLGACQSEPESLEEVEVPEKSEGFFWEGEHNDKEVYILGTIHMGAEEMYPLRDVVEEVIASTDYLMTETYIDDPDLQEEINELRKENFYLEGDERLSDQLNEEELERLRHMVENNNLTFDMANSMQPWAVRDEYNLFLYKESDYSFNRGVEEYLYENIPEGTEIGSLEDPIEQIDILRSPDIEGMVYHLKKLLSTPIEEILEETNQSVKAWRAGEERFIDLSREIDMDSENAKAAEDYVNRMLFIRDENIADSIEDAIENHEAETILFAAGYAHFFGKDNVIDLLAERGYDFERK